jgi:putative hydrolase of the HAD superfamily
LKKYKHIFFDLDGTLWDLYKNTEEALRQLYVEFGLNEDSFERFYKRYHYHNEKVWALYRVGKIEKEILRTIRFSRAFDDVSISQTEATVEAFASRFLEVCPRLPHLIDGTLELLDLAKTKASLQIITNGFKEVQGFKIEGGGLGGYFQEIVNSEDAGFRKPSKEIFEYAMKKANALASESLMVGDDWDADIIGARDAGLDQAFLTNTERMQHKLTGEAPSRHNYQANYTIDSLRELIPLFQ